MRTALLLALLVLSAPLAAAKEPAQARYPRALLDLLPAWTDAADAAGRDAQGQPLSPDAQAYLEKAREAAREGRFRVALFDLETHHQLSETRRLLDQAASQGSVPRQKEHVLARDAAHRQAAMEDWAQYRARLHALDGQLRSLHAAELALFSADLALTALVQTQEGEAIRAAFSRESGVDEALVAGLVRTSLGVSRALEHAHDVLDAAGAFEGLPPRLDASAWNETVAAAMVEPEGETPPHLAPLERVAGGARGQGEGLLAVALQLASLRQARFAVIMQQYGEAGARGRDVVADATVGLRRGMENVSVEAPLRADLLGVFTADALDHARYTLAFAERGQAGLPTIAYAWAALEHQARATDLLAHAAGNGPAAAPPEDRDAPLPIVPLLAAATVLGALLAGRARRKP